LSISPDVNPPDFKVAESIAYNELDDGVQIIDCAPFVITAEDQPLACHAGGCEPTNSAN
jgi:hypothetical protein